MPTHPTCFVIAEIGVNHNGSEEMAKQLCKHAANAGADAVKFQTFRAEDLVSRHASQAAYQQANTQSSQTQFEMLEALRLSDEAHHALKAYCQTLGIEFMSTPFSEEAVDFLDQVGVDRYKVSSGDLTHLPLLRHIATKKRPVILSTGMARMAEIEQALDVFSDGQEACVSLLHCVSNYPADPEECNLAAMDSIAQAFKVPVGWSDHSEGSAISWAAVARGARIIEKHITLDRALPGPDHKASMEPEEFARFVAGIRHIELAIGDGIKRPTPTEIQTAAVGRRSLVASRDLFAGQAITLDDIKIVRPGTGLPPHALEHVIGMTLSRNVACDTPLDWADFQNG